MQFVDFVFCGFNQLVNVFVKFYYCWEQSCLVVVWLFLGGGVGVGIYYLQNLEGWFVYVVGFKVVCLVNVQDVYVLLCVLIWDLNFVIFCEYKFFYWCEKGVFGLGFDGEFGKVWIVCFGRDILLIGYGVMMCGCFEVVEWLVCLGVEVEVVDLCILVLFDQVMVIELVQCINCVFVVYELQLMGGFGVEVSVCIVEYVFFWFDVLVVCVVYVDWLVLFVKLFEQQFFLIVDCIVEGVEKVFCY